MNMLDILRQGFFILEGYCKWIYNRVTGKTSEQTKRRLRLCVNCEHSKHGICELCGCIIKAKVRVDFPLDENGKSIGGCPLQNW